jgi:L-ornithine N5-monooxygenase
MSPARSNRDFDVLGIGFGPSNLAVAIALEEAQTKLDFHFIEGASDACWHPGMLLNGSDVQNNPLRDLVTPRNPKSHFTFTNYLKESGRLFDFLNLGILYPLRKDYSKYIKWVADHFADKVTYSTRAEHVFYDAASDRWCVETAAGTYTGRALVVGTGRSRNTPEVFQPHLGQRVFHLCDYLPKIEKLAPTLSSIAVIGASQSAVEILLDLMGRFPDLEIHSVHRSYSMRQKDTSPFSDHVYFPEFVDYFFKASPSARNELQSQLRHTNYSAADLDVLHKLYLNIYEERLDGRERVRVHNNTLIEGVAADHDRVTLSLRERILNETSELRVDAVVLATGFRDIGVGEGKEPYPKLLSGAVDELTRDERGALLVERDYSVKTNNGLPLYLNGLCESSHGLGDAGSFSLLSLRATEILNSLESHFRDLPPRAEADMRPRLKIGA